MADIFRNSFCCALAVAFVQSAFVQPAVAQVEEIIVTTRYKEESLQEVPIAVTAIGADAIERRGIADLFKLAEVDPSVSFDTSFGPGDTRVSIRGLSNTRGRSNVAFLVDGVDVTSENQIAAGSGLLANQRLLTDVERIEIVKGPQSALYGRAAFAGAIAYTTKKPTEELTGSIGVDGAEYGQYQVKGSLSGPVSDTLGFRLDGVGWTADGAYRNSVSGAHVGGGKGWGGSAKLVWDPADTFTLSTRIAYSEDQNDPRPVAVPVYDEFVQYAPEATTAGFGVGDVFGGNGYRLGVVNHGTFCPDLGVVNDGNPLDPNFANTLPGVAPGTPGICQPGNMGSVADLPFGKNSIALSETLDGREQEGSTLDLFRASVNAGWATGRGQLQFIGGYTKAAQTDEHDQDFQAFGRPDRLGTNDPYFNYGNNIAVGHQQADTDTDTRQISGELRFSTDFEGPVNAILGYLRWDLKVATEDRNYIANCQMALADLAPGTENVITGLPTIRDATATNVCDGGNATTLIGGSAYNGDTYDNWQQYMRQFLVTPATAGLAVDPRTSLQPGRLPGAPWLSDTDHQSFYLRLDWDITETLELTTEARWVDEKFSILRPNQASCANIGIGYGFYDDNGTPGDTSDDTAGSRVLGGAWLIEGTGTAIPPFVQAAPDLNCSSVTGIATFVPGWAVIEGSEDASFITPKATLNWYWADGKLAYFSWAKAQKPGGINQLAAGGSAVTIDDLRFLPEKMTTWELGTKSTWEAAGALVTNAAIFFNDYTDKQVSTQVLDPNGSLQPRVVNAAAAEVLGAELDVTWAPSAVDGLTLRAAYTWQDGEYTDFVDLTTSAIRAGYQGACNVVDPAGNGELFCALDLSGNALERQAKNAFSGSVSYFRPLGDSATEWFVEGDASYTGKRYLDQDNFVYFDSYWLTNVRVGLQADAWDVTLFINNALDDDTIRSGGSGPDFALQNTRLGFTAGLGVNGFFGILPEPRTIGLRTNFRF